MAPFGLRPRGGVLIDTVRSVLIHAMRGMLIDTAGGMLINRLADKLLDLRLGRCRPGLRLSLGLLFWLPLAPPTEAHLLEVFLNVTAFGLE